MKTTIFIIAALIFGLFACAQKPPKAVTDNFAKKFVGADKVKWDTEEENEWEAEFKMNGKEMSACFDNAGKWLNTEAVLSEKELPADILKAVQTSYPGWKIESVESYETPELKGFELGIEKGKEKLEILVNSDRTIKINKESKEKDEDEEK